MSLIHRSLVTFFQRQSQCVFSLRFRGEPRLRRMALTRSKYFQFLQTKDDGSIETSSSVHSDHPARSLISKKEQKSDRVMQSKHSEQGGHKCQGQFEEQEKEKKEKVSEDVKPTRGKRKRPPITVKYENDNDVPTQSGIYQGSYSNVKKEEEDTPSTEEKFNIKIEYVSNSFKDEKSSCFDESQAQVSTNWSPPGWLEQYQNIEEMRKARDAPVDTMGCDVISDRTADPKDFRYQVLVSLMLSSQTRDEVTSSAMHRLRQHGCSARNIVATSDEILGMLIYPVGFWRKKVGYIKKASQILVDKFSGDIPDNISQLCCLPGVGPKMAHLAMKSAWQVVTGIGVDTHVHRISNRLGWTAKPTHEPEETRKALEAWLPKELWAPVNHLLVGFGQTICQPVRPKCEICLNQNCCPVGLGLKPASPAKKKPAK